MWLGSVPPLVVYLLLLLAIGVESMGIPVPGEVALVSASLLAATGAVSPWGVAGGAAAGAIIGDSIGYLIGRRGGRALFERIGRRFPRHMGPDKIDRAQRSFQRHGLWAVFFGRFVMLLRIFAGPLAGWLRLPYLRFLLANAGGGILWAGGTTFAIYLVGQAAERWLKDLSWILLAAVVAGGALTMFILRNRSRAAEDAADTEDAEDDAGDPDVSYLPSR
jgi:membrane protein DedA with SNARE-associated domain